MSFRNRRRFFFAAATGSPPELGLSLHHDFLKASGTAASAVVVSGASPTFTRAGTGWNFNESGLLVSAGTNVPRFDHNFAGTALGLLLEEARTNSALWSRDKTNAVWVKTNITAAKDATGLDGSANSASSLTATAGNGTCLQSITLGSAARAYSVYVKRKTGAGNIDITDNNGVNWTTLAGLSAGAFTRYEITRTQANPVIGFRIVTSGDAVEVDVSQLETGAFALSPIITTTVAVTRPVDIWTFPDTQINVPNGALMVDHRPAKNATNNMLLEGGTLAVPIRGFSLLLASTARPRVLWIHGSNRNDNTQANTRLDLVDGVSNRVAFTWDTAAPNVGIVVARNGIDSTNSTNIAVSQSDFNGTIRLGSRANNSIPSNGHYAALKVFNVTKTKLQLQLITA